MQVIAQLTWPLMTVHRRRVALGMIACALVASLVSLTINLAGDAAPAPMLANVSLASSTTPRGDAAATADNSPAQATVYGMAPSPADAMLAASLASLETDLSDEETTGASSSQQRWFNGRPIRPARTIEMLVTAYSPDARSCGESADGITASGYSVWTNGMKLVAADTRLLPFGSLLTIPGYDAGEVVPVLDRGGAIKGTRLDVLFPSHEEAIQWGARKLRVIVWEYADGRNEKFQRQH